MACPLCHILSQHALPQSHQSRTESGAQVQEAWPAQCRLPESERWEREDQGRENGHGCGGAAQLRTTLPWCWGGNSRLQDAEGQSPLGEGHEVVENGKSAGHFRETQTDRAHTWCSRGIDDNSRHGGECNTELWEGAATDAACLGQR